MELEVKKCHYSLFWDLQAEASPIIYMKIGTTEITLKNSPRQAQYLINLSLTESAMASSYSDIVFTLFDGNEFKDERGVIYEFTEQINCI